tara:strand:- start:2169 stop:2564 length:396 start_codon:yes stop_codon:yes gene_type:complete
MRIKRADGFTLIEMVVAVAVFAVAVFAILNLVVMNLSVVKEISMLNREPNISDLAMRTMVDAQMGMLEEGVEDVLDEEFEAMFPDWRWTRDVMLMGTNGLYRVRIYLENSDDEDKMKTLNLLVFQPTDAGR